MDLRAHGKYRHNINNKTYFIYDLGNKVILLSDFIVQIEVPVAKIIKKCSCCIKVA